MRQETRVNRQEMLDSWRETGKGRQEMRDRSRVAEPFHFGLALAPASQDGGSGCSSSSSSSPVVHNLLLKKKFSTISLLNLPGLVLFKERYE